MATTDTDLVGLADVLSEIRAAHAEHSRAAALPLPGYERVWHFHAADEDAALESRILALTETRTPV